MNTERAFPARSGHELQEQLGEGRVAQVMQAWESLLQIRRLTESGQERLPAAWERRQPMRAVGLALERAGAEFAVVDEQGVVVRSGVQLAEEAPGVVRAVWAHRRGERPADGGDARLREAAAAVGKAGWDGLVYQAGPKRFLLIEPGHGG